MNAAQEIADLYDKYEHSVQGIAINFARRHRLDVQECIAEANLIFMNIFHDTDPTQASFEIRLHYLLPRRLYDVIRRESSRGMRYHEPTFYFVSTEFALDVEESAHAPFDYADLEEIIGPDAKQMLNLARNAPPCLEKRSSRTAIRRHLKGLGWRNSRVSRAFRELERAIV